VKREERGPAHHESPLKISRHQATDRLDRSSPAGQREVTAVAYSSPPIGRCSLWVLIVPRCPSCLHTHVHRSSGDHGGRRTGSCGATYRVVIAGRGKGAA
jgi:hypothetical protein